MDGAGGPSRHLMILTRRTAGLAWILALGLMSPGAARGADPGEGPPLRVGHTPIFPPMVFKKGRELVGVEVDLARGFERHLRRSIQWVEVPWKDQIAALNEGRTDIIISSMSVTMARGFVVAFTEPYLTIDQMALVRRRDLAFYAMGFPVIPPGPVGVIKGTTGAFLMEREFPGAKIRDFVETDSAVKALMRKRVDLFVSDSTLIWYLAGVHSGDGLSALPIALGKERVAWAVRKGDDALLQQANQYLSQAAKDGSLEQVLRRWMAVGP